MPWLLILGAPHARRGGPAAHLAGSSHFGGVPASTAGHCGPYVSRVEMLIAGQHRLLECRRVEGGRERRIALRAIVAAGLSAAGAPAGGRR